MPHDPTQIPAALFTEVLQAIRAARPSTDLPDASAAALALAADAWTFDTFRAVHTDLTRTLRGLVEDAGYDPDMLPVPPLPVRTMTITGDQVTLLVPDPDDALIAAIKTIPGQAWNATDRYWTVPAIGATLEPLRMLVRRHRLAPTPEAIDRLKAVAADVAANPDAAALATIAVTPAGRVTVTLTAAHPTLADALKRVPSLKWDPTSGAYTAPGTRLRDTLAATAAFHTIHDPSVAAALSNLDAPLLYDGTLDGLRGIPVTDLHTMDAKKAERFAEFGIHSIFDLLLLTPRRYLDRSNLTPIRALQAGQEVGILATVTAITVDQRKRLVRITVSDPTGKLSVTYFNAIWQAKRFRTGDEVAIWGKVEAWTGSSRTMLGLTNPIMDPVGDDTLAVIPVYPQSAKSRITTWEVHTAAAEALRRLGTLSDPLPAETVTELDLMARGDALRTIHLPSSLDAATAARSRLAFDELYRMQAALLLRKASEEAETGIAHVGDGSLTGPFLAGLPYALTGAQNRAWAEIATNLAAVHPMHRLLQGDVGAGKAQPLTSGVLTPTGYRPMGEIKLGDAVINPTGEITHVTGVFPQGIRPVFRVCFSDGTSVRADGEHLWEVRTSVMRHKGRTAKIMTTQQIRSDLKEKNGASKWHVELVQSPELDGLEARPVDPYLLGVLLGDGSLKYGQVTVTTMDDDMIDFVAKALPGNMEVATVVKASKATTYRLRNRKGPEIASGLAKTDTPAILAAHDAGHSLTQIASSARAGTPAIRKILVANGRTIARPGSGPNPLMEDLRGLGLMDLGAEDKFVPTAYLNAPIADRIAILQGLLDTDGSLDARTGLNVTFSTVSEQLAQDVAWLVRSLGGRSRAVRRNRKSGMSWHVSVLLHNGTPPFRIGRKLSGLGVRTKYASPARAIVAIEDDGAEHVQCISVAHPNQLYVTDNFTVTHNTTVALLTLLTGVESGYQGALMAPTEILASQLHAELLERTAGLHTRDGRPLRVEFFSNKLRGKKRDAILADLAAGRIDIAVGTHALLVGDVTFQHLGVVVVDEQHRFGVEQRAALREKGALLEVNGTQVHVRPDMLVMTATPIPRTASMTVFGDLDVSVLDELPPGRTPILTSWIDAAPDLFSHDAAPWPDVRAQVALGRQAYVVTPLVEESEKLQATSAVETFEALSNGALAGLRVGLVHGQQNGDERAATMAGFRDGTIDVLVATTVIEVGVNVPNATVIAVLDSGRFGIAQLHQLRGRVGRGKHASSCVLVGRCTSPDGRARMEALVASTDGFYLSEVDLALRGHGQVFGTAQSGQSDLRVADLDTDRDLLVTARDHAARLLDGDSRLARHPGLRAEIVAVLGVDGVDWLGKS